jgi:hypothetical protein
LGLTLTLSVGNMELYSRAEDSSPVVATKRAFDELHSRLAECPIEFQGKDIWPRSKGNRSASDTRSGIRPELTTYLTQSSLTPADNSLRSMRN